MERIFSSLGHFWSSASAIWDQGGWAMTAIAIIALVMFSVGMNILLKLRATGYTKVDEASWRRWIDTPDERQGPIGKMIDTVAEASTLEESSMLFEQVRQTEVQPFERDLRVMKVCVSAAPLVGLLGTVTGMLSTFDALSSGSGGEKTMTMVAAGISEALVTTETGLVIALPGLFFQYQLRRKFESYRASIAHLETVCTQVLYRKLRKGHKQDLRRVAQSKIAEALYRALTASPQFQSSSPQTAGVN